MRIPLPRDGGGAGSCPRCSGAQAMPDARWIPATAALGGGALAGARDDPLRACVKPAARAVVQWREPIAYGPGRLAFSRFSCLRTGRTYLTRSERDRELLLIVDTCVDIRDARLHPAIVTFFASGIEHTCEPWLWVRRATHDEFWCRWTAAQRAQGVDHALREQLVPLRLALVNVDPAMLLCHDALELARTLRRHSRHPVDLVTREQARRLLVEHAPPVLFQDVLHGRHPTLRCATVCRLIFDGAARLVPSGSLRAHTRVVFVEPQPTR